MALRKTPADIAPAFNELTFIDDAATEITVRGVYPSREDSITLSRVRQTMPNPENPAVNITAARFDAKTVVSGLFINRTQDINWWAKHNYNLKCLYTSSLDSTTRTALNAVQQIGETLDMYEAGASAVLTHYKKQDNGRAVIPAYPGFPVGATIMAKKWYELNLEGAFTFDIAVPAGVEVRMNLSNTSGVMAIWGDGTIERYTGATKYQIKHTYTTAETYRCSILVDEDSEYLSNAQVSDLSSQNIHVYMTAVVQWAKMRVCCLRDSPVLASIPNEVYPGALTQVRYMFYACRALAVRIPVDFFKNVRPGITDLSYVFAGAGTNNPYKIWEHLNGETFKYFPEATILDYLCFDTVGVAYSALRYTMPSNFFRYMRKVTSMRFTFAQCNFSSIPVSTFRGLTELITIESAFLGNYFPTIPGDLFIDCVNVTTIGGLFSNAYEATAISVNAFRGMSNATNLASALSKMPGIQAYPLGLLDHTPEVTTIAAMFDGAGSASNYIRIPDGFFKPLTKVINCSSLFINAYVAEFDSTMFYYMPDLTNARAVFANAKCAAGAVLKDTTFGNAAKITTVESMFAQVSGELVVSSGALTGLGPGVTTMDNFCYNAAGVTFAPGAFAEWRKVQTMYRAFYRCAWSPEAGAFDNMVELRDIDSAFNYASMTTLNQVFGTTPKPKVQHINGTFSSMPLLTTVVADVFAPFVACTEITQAFTSAYMLTAIPEDLMSKCPATVITSNFQYCPVVIPPKLWAQNKVCQDFSRNFLTSSTSGQATGSTPVTDEGYKLWERAGKSGYPETIVGRYCFMFQDNITDVAAIPATWKTL